jgi:hypothetical protein
MKGQRDVWEASLSRIGAIAFLLILGCSASSATTVPSEQTGSGAGGVSGGTGGSTPSGGTAGSAQGGTIVVGTGGSSGQGSPACTPDLHGILGTNGDVIATCPPEQACSKTGCVPACEAFASLHSSVGCDFLAATPSVMTLYKPGCFAVFVTNAWGRSARIEISRGNATFDVTTIGRVVGTGADVSSWPPIPSDGLAPDEVAVLFLSSDTEANSGDGTDTTCPVTPAVLAPGGAAVYVRSPEDPKDAPAEQTGKGVAFRITSDSPVSVYGILPFGGAKSVDPSATLLFPTSVWGTNYVAIVPPKIYEDQFNSQWGQILASNDDTKIELVAASSLPAGGGVAAAPEGILTSYALNAGEFIQWQDSGEMTGTAMLADKPIAFYGGASALTYDSSMPECENGASDNAHQQLPPIPALGSEYVAAPYHSRISIPESVPYRLVGLVDGTTLSYDPVQPAAPTTLARGAVAEFESTTAFTVRSQDETHPFYVAQIMPGCGKGDPTGDEEFVNVVPSGQYLAKYVFFTDPTYGTTNLVFVRKKMSSGFSEVEVDCIGVISGWKDVGTDGVYQVADADLVRHGNAVGSCTNGRHVAESTGPFALVVWGLDNWASYGYPAGSGAVPLHSVVVDPVVR